MNGAERLIRTAAEYGVRACFANAGTSELPLVSALSAVSEIKPILGLAEAVCTGAADGYGRMVGAPAITLLHMGPGLANGLAYLHNARRAGTPLLNVVGDHRTWHLSADAPLTSDIATLASFACSWVGTTRSSEATGLDALAALRATTAGPACLIVPTDHQSGGGGGAVPVDRLAEADEVEGTLVVEVAKRLRKASRAALFLGGRALSEEGLAAAGRIASVTGCTLIHETFPARLERGPHLPKPQKLPYTPGPARAALQGFELLILVGAREPVSFFGYEGQRSSFVDVGTEVVEFAAAPQDGAVDAVSALRRLADDLGAPPWKASDTRAPEEPVGRLTPPVFGAAVAAAQPDGVIIVDESVTSGFTYQNDSVGSPQHTYLVPHLGGAIGHGLPVATGAALACPDRSVLLLEADGSAAYTVQSLWTQAREALNVTTVICANRSYAVLQGELGTKPRPGDGALHDLLNIDGPAIDWVRIAEGFGVPALRADTAESLMQAIQRFTSESGPHLIEAVID